MREVLYVLIAGRFPYDDDIFDDGPNENYVGSPKMKEIYDKLAKYKVREACGRQLSSRKFFRRQGF